ncbi:restriction endonuclease subunit S [Streptomyces sp. NBC_01216]|uniref:restriction endonuclease subunit S n=1 Tax=Streptomyces sp. NBC_01216 TaxID=2903778 RepID=UPI002E13BCB1|nr:restriction endonuclease subunit S [Streptomyces sp. NBC_01216]
MSVESSEGGLEAPGGTESAGLPEGWAWVKLADILSEPTTNGRSVRSDDDGFPVLRLTALKRDGVDCSEHKLGDWTAEEAAPYLIQPGDFLVSRGNGSLSLVGRGALVTSVTEPVAFPDTMIRIRTSPDHVDPRFLAHLWSSPAIRRQVEKSARTGTGIHKVSQAAVQEVEFALPPTAEQHRIADALDARLSHLDKIESRLMAAQRRLNHLRNFAMTAAATGVLAWDADSQHLPIAGAPGVKDGTLPLLASGWRWTRLQDIADVVGGVSKDSKNQHDPALPEVPYLRVANAQRARLDLSQVSKIRVPPKTLAKLRLRDGDLLMTEGGDRDKLGRGWIWADEIEDCIHQNHLFRARILDQATHPKLLGWYVNSAARSWFEDNGKQSVNLASISISKVKMLPVPVPPPDEAEQAGFVELGERVLARFDRLVSACEKGLGNAAALRRTLLSEALSGRLLPQDPDNESAEDLLKRIRAEREAAEVERKAARRAAAQAKRKRHVGSKAPAPADTPPPPAPTSDTLLPEGEQDTLPLEFTA